MRFKQKGRLRPDEDSSRLKPPGVCLSKSLVIVTRNLYKISFPMRSLVQPRAGLRGSMCIFFRGVTDELEEPSTQLVPFWD